MKTALLTIFTFGVWVTFAQADFFVSAGGSDAHNGLTQDTPFKTLSQALLAAKESGVRKIIVIGSLDAESEAGEGEFPDGVFYIRDTGGEEIVITGQDGESGAERTAELRGVKEKRVLTIQGNAHILLREIRITGGDTALNGGGIALEGGARLTLGKGAMVQGNRAEEGGGVCARDGVLTLEADGAIKDNTARGDEGGGALLFNTVFTMRDNAMISGNEGGGVVMYGGAGTLLDNAAIEENRCLFDGGGVALYTGELFIQGRARVRGNQAGRNGGGVLAVTGTVMIREEGSVANNQAGNDGGGVAVLIKGLCVVRGQGSILGNRAVDDGGGVYNLASELVFKENARVLNNIALCGGGLCAEGNLGPGTSFVGGPSFSVVQDQTLVQGNQALGDTQGGGGLCVGIDAVILMKGGEVRENRSVNGGGVYLDGGGFKHSGGVITDNRARHGGGVYKQAGTLKITKGDISGNAPNDIVAPSGGFNDVTHIRLGS